MKRLALLALILPSMLWTTPAEAAAPLCFGKRPTIVGIRGYFDYIEGTEGNDVIWAKDGNDVVWGRGGNDRICGGRGSDTLNGGIDIFDSPQHTNGDPHGADLIAGNEGSDSLYDNDGGIRDDAADRLLGGKGNDFLIATGGEDLLEGGDGNDEILDDGTQRDILDGGAGNDYLDARDGNLEVGDWLEGGPGPKDTCWGDEDDERGSIDSYSDACYFFGDPDDFPDWPN